MKRVLFGLLLIGWLVSPSYAKSLAQTAAGVWWTGQPSDNSVPSGFTASGAIGYVIRLRMKNIETADGTYNFTALDTIANAIVGATCNSVPCLLTLDIENDAPGVPDWLLTDLQGVTGGLLTSTITWQPQVPVTQLGVTHGTCGTFLWPVPWEATFYQPKVDAFWTHIRNEANSQGWLSSVAMVINTYSTFKDDETTVPPGNVNIGGTPYTCTGASCATDPSSTCSVPANPCSCAAPNDAGALVGVNYAYTPAKWITAHQHGTSVLAADFPNALVSTMWVLNGFPPINAAGTVTGNTNDLNTTMQLASQQEGPVFPTQFASQNNGFSNVNVNSIVAAMSPDVAATAAQSNAGSTMTNSAGLAAGLTLALQDGVNIVQLYPNELTAAGEAPIVAWYNKEAQAAAAHLRPHSGP